MSSTHPPVDGVALDLTAHRNSIACWEPGVAVPEGFDGYGRTYPAGSLAPRAGDLHLPPGFGRGEPDNVACEGQILHLDHDLVAGPVPSAVTVVHVVGAGTQGVVRETFRLYADQGERADLASHVGEGATEVAVTLGDFLTRGPVPGAECYHQAGFLYDIGGRPEPSVQPRLWYAVVPLPRPVPCIRLELPFNPDMHVFGIWVTGTSGPPVPLAEVSATDPVTDPTPAIDDREHRP